MAFAACLLGFEILIVGFIDEIGILGLISFLDV